MSSSSPLDRLDPKRFPFDPFDPSKTPDPVEEDHIHRAAIRAAIGGADAYRLTRAALRKEGEALRVGNRFVPRDRYREIGFVALGRAAVSQALAIVDSFGSKVTQGFVVGPTVPPPELPFRSMERPSETAGHSAAAEVGAAVRELAEGLRPDDLFVVLLSAGALGYLAGPPAGSSPEAWRAELERCRAGGASGRELDLLARVTGSGPIAGRLATGLACEVATCVVDRGAGPVLLGGGPTIAIAPTERTEARHVLERIGRWGQLAAPAQREVTGLAAGAPALPGTVHRPVVVAEPADGLRDASDAVAEKQWIARLAAPETRDSPSAAADRFLERTEAHLAGLGGSAFFQESRGLIAFAPLTFDLAEGADERPAVQEFLRRADGALRRREMTVAAVATGGAARSAALPPGGIVGAPPGAPPRPMRLRAGITDVGVLATAAIPRRRR